MGVEGLLPFLRTKAADGVRTNVPLSEYSGLTMAIDANVNLYAFVHTSDPPSLGFAQLALQLIFYKIKPIFIFDGPAGSIKSRTKEKRDLTLKKRLEDFEVKLKTPESFSQEELIKSEKYARSLTYDDRHRAFVMLQTLGIPVVKAAGESDLLIAALYRDKIIDGCFTRDGDLIAHGVDLVVSGISAFGDNMQLTDYRLPKILEKLDISYSSFVDMCMLMGNDYVEGVLNMGPATAYKFIKLHGTVEKVRAFVDAEKLKPKKVTKPRKPTQSKKGNVIQAEGNPKEEGKTKEPPKKREYVFPDDDKFPLAEARITFTTSEPRSMDKVSEIQNVLSTWKPLETLDEKALCEVEPLCTAALAKWMSTTWQSAVNADTNDSKFRLVAPHDVRVKRANILDTLPSMAPRCIMDDEDDIMDFKPKKYATIVEPNQESASGTPSTSAPIVRTKGFSSANAAMYRIIQQQPVQQPVAATTTLPSTFTNYTFTDEDAMDVDDDLIDSDKVDARVKRSWTDM